MFVAEVASLSWCLFIALRCLVESMRFCGVGVVALGVSCGTVVVFVIVCGRSCNYCAAGCRPCCNVVGIISASAVAVVVVMSCCMCRGVRAPVPVNMPAVSSCVPKSQTRKFVHRAH